jgi:hypothetical protein
VTEGCGRSSESRPEILKLARLLHRDPDSLSYLGVLTVDDVRRLREQVTDLLFSTHHRTFARLAAASKLLPASLNAAIAQRAFGPVLAARITGQLEPSRAVEVAERLPPSFLADVAIELDPRRASDVIAQIPPWQIASITAELVKRDEYVTMGRFLGHLPDAAVAAAVEVTDDRALLRTGFVLEEKSRLEQVADLLGPERLERVIETARGEDLWPEALDLLTYLNGDRQRRLIEQAVKRDDVLESLLRAAERYGMWEELLALQSVTSDASQERLIRFVEERHPELLGRLGPLRRRA